MIKQNPSSRGVITEPINAGDPFSELRLPDGTVATDGQVFIAQYLIQRYGWIYDPCPDLSRPWPYHPGDVQAFAREVYRRYPAITSDEHKMIPDLVNIILATNDDPYGTDLLGTVLDLLEYIREIS